MSWTGPKELRAQVQRLWDRGLLLTAIPDDALEFPRRLQLKTPSSRELSDDYQAVREWIVRLRDAKGIRIEYRNLQHRILGENAVPDTAWLDSAEAAVRLLGNQKEHKQFVQLAAQTRECKPALLPWVQERPLKALALAEHWSKLLEIVSWMQHNPRPGIYLRQVSIAGIDSKFIERHRAVLIPLLDLTLPAATTDLNAKGVGGFEQRYGFRSRPLTVRFRILDPVLATLPGGDRDITLTSEDFREVYQHESYAKLIRRVFITENEINFLSFPPIENGLVIFGAGYGFDALADVPWLSRSRIYYWGDIDTHGFAILDQLRHRYPTVRSFLMDEATLQHHKAFWGRENTAQIRRLERLTPEEQQLYQDLQSGRWGNQLRLEQERVDYKFFLSSLELIEQDG